MNKFICSVLSLIAIFSFSINANASVENPKLFLAFVIDESGSMSNSKDDTIGSFNSLIDEHKQMEDGVDVFVVTNFFNTSDHFVHEATYIQEVEDITEKDYTPKGGTALLDAVGNTVNYLDELVCENPDSLVMLVIITDGKENSSKEFNKSTIKKILKERQEMGWNLQFYGAGVEAYDDARELGFTQENSVCFRSTAEDPRVIRNMVRVGCECSMECRKSISREKDKSKIEKPQEPKNINSEKEKKQNISTENKKSKVENKEPKNINSVKEKKQNTSTENKKSKVENKAAKSNIKSKLKNKISNYLKKLKS